MAHSDIVAYHVRHRAGQQMGLVSVEIDAHAYRCSSANGILGRKTRLAILERFTPKIKNVLSLQLIFKRKLEVKKKLSFEIPKIKK